MNRRITTALLLAAAATGASMAQSAYDAYSLIPTQLRGTARFVSMGGAFTSLGGDLSTLGQNPAGLAMYRYNDIGATLNISAASFNAATNQGSLSHNQTKAYFDNFGYAGVVNLNGAMRSFNWGVSYSRLQSFDRVTSGRMYPTTTSLTNYIANYTNGINSDDILETKDFNPFETGEDWLSILAYNSFMINNTAGSNTSYAGLFKNNTNGDAMFELHEFGHVDEYNIDFAGNISDIVYWGVGVGIMDMEYSAETNYSESMSEALVYNSTADALSNGDAEYYLYNQKHVNGTGANIKVGLILRPVDQLRIGLAVHTPTWMHLSHYGYGATEYSYTPVNEATGEANGAITSSKDPYYTPDFDYRSRLNTPWRIMAGISYVIGGRAIISADYEHIAYNDMKLKQENTGFYGGFSDNEYANADVKEYFKGSDIFRLGAELRVTNSFSIRAGYNYQSTAVRDAATAPGANIYTYGTDPSYSFYGDINNVSVGLGYRYGGWYIDFAYQHSRREGTYHAFTDFAGQFAPTAKLKNTYNNFVLSTGFRF